MKMLQCRLACIIKVLGMALQIVWQIRKIPRWAPVAERKIKKLIEKLGLQEDELNIIMCSDAYIRKLNKRFRNRNETTDVLSFPMDNPAHYLVAGGDLGVRARQLPTPIVLGDVFVSTRRVEKQARENGNSAEDELFSVVTHGVLHLLGFDHHKRADSIVMTRLERKIFKHFGVEVREFGH